MYKRTIFNKLTFLRSIIKAKNICISKKNRFFASCLTQIFKNMSEIEQKVKSIIVEKLGVEEKEVIPEASFTNDLGADSLDTVELIMELENQFGIQIPDEDAEKISTVGNAIKYIEEHIESK